MQTSRILSVVETTEGLDAPIRILQKAQAMRDLVFSGPNDGCLQAPRGKPADCPLEEGSDECEEGSDQLNPYFSETESC